jgi:hypothetical protein
MIVGKKFFETTNILCQYAINAKKNQHPKKVLVFSDMHLSLIIEYGIADLRRLD